MRKTRLISLLLTALLTPAAFARPARTADAPPCTQDGEPLCLYEALTRPEMALLFALSLNNESGFLEDKHAYIVNAADRPTLKAAWRARLREEALRLVREGKTGQVELKGAPATLAKLGSAYAAARAAGMDEKTRKMFNGVSDEFAVELADPAKKQEAVRLGRLYQRTIQKLSLTDIGSLSGSSVEAQTDLMGAWLADCLTPAGGAIKAMRSRSRACRVP